MVVLILILLIIALPWAFILLRYFYGRKQNLILLTVAVAPWGLAMATLALLGLLAEIYARFQDAPNDRGIGLGYLATLVFGLFFAICANGVLVGLLLFEPKIPGPDLKARQSPHRHGL